MSIVSEKQPMASSSADFVIKIEELQQERLYLSLGPTSTPYFDHSQKIYASHREISPITKEGYSCTKIL